MKYSKAIFGSLVREDFDKYSDKDLIIVAENYKSLRELQNIYSTTDWSISYYTYSKLEKISMMGGLFIQHLKEESKILVDADFKLKTILDSFEPKNDYTSDIQSSYSFFKYCQNHCYSPRMNGWMCDIIYVGLRNLLIYQHAQISKYEFSYLKLLDFFKTKLLPNEVQILKELRIIKRSYRNNIEDELPCDSYMASLFNILVKLNLVPFYNILSAAEFENKILHDLVDEDVSAYSKIRLFEGFYINNNFFDVDIHRVVTNPQMYTFCFNDSKYISQLIDKLVMSKSPNDILSRTGKLTDLV